MIPKASPQETLRSIEHYLADNPDTDPLSALGLTDDRRIVQLVEQAEQQRPALKQALEQQLLALMPPGQAGALKDRSVGTLNSECQPLDNFLNKFRRDGQIRKRLEKLKKQYASQFAFMNERTRTYDHMHELGFGNGETVTGGEGTLWGESWGYHFRNLLTPEHWELKTNAKRLGRTSPRALFTSNVLVHQLEWSFQRNGWFLQLPKTIEEKLLLDKQNLKVFTRHKSDYLSAAFLNDFLKKTETGKSIAHVARDLGLKIDRVTVTYNDRPVDKIDDLTSDTLDNLEISVLVHVSPDPAVYGSP